MKKTTLFLLFMMIIGSLGAQKGRQITIIHTNDLHSRLAGFAPELNYSPLSVNDDKTLGGFSRIAAIIENEKKNAGGITLVLDAGDFLMGTLFQGLEPSTGFQLRLMKKMGYDAVCIGNHEFDFGPAKLAEIINSSISNGEIPPIISSNIQFDPEDNGDNALDKLFNDGRISRTLIIEKEGIRIGLFSLMGVVADDNAAYARPVTFSRQIPAAKKMVRELKNNGCEMIICLSHSGVSKDNTGGWSGEDVELARKVKDIDVIISGHTHTTIEEPIMINNTVIVQTGEYGKSVGVLKMALDGEKYEAGKYVLVPVDDRIMGSREVAAMIDEQEVKLTNEILLPIGLDYGKPVAESDFPVECNEQGEFRNSNLGPLVADAIYNYVNKNVPGGTDVAMVAVGVIRDNIVPGIQTAPDIFRIMSMGAGNDNVPGYPLSRLYVTGHELKGILEIMYIAGESTPANYCFYSGLKAEYDPGKGLLKKISKVSIANSDGAFREVDFSKNNPALYSIVANSYMLEYVSIIKKLSKGLVKVIPKDVNGLPVNDMKNTIMDFDSNREGTQEGREWLAIVHYLKTMKDINGNGVPDIDQKYKVAIKSFSVTEGK